MILVNKAKTKMKIAQVCLFIKTSYSASHIEQDQQSAFTKIE